MQILEIRSEYMKTAITESEPPSITRFLSALGIQDQFEIKSATRAHKAGNWIGHWHKHHAQAHAIIVAEEESTILAGAQAYATKRAELLRTQLETVEVSLPAVEAELMQRIDFMDDKALVAFFKVLVDSRRDLVDKLAEMADKTKPSASGGSSNSNQAGGPVPSSRLIAVAVAVLEAKEKGIDPMEIIDTVATDERRASAFDHIDAKLKAGK